MSDPKVGDIFEIPLSKSQKAYCQYVCRDNVVGPIIQVFDLITDLDVEMVTLRSRRPLFPPVVAELFAAARSSAWKLVGHIAVEKTAYPGFVSTFWDQDTGRARSWFLWDGERSTRLGNELPEEYRSREYLFVWSSQAIVDRIENGKFPLPYANLLSHNMFAPPPDTS